MRQEKQDEKKELKVESMMEARLWEILLSWLWVGVERRRERERGGRKLLNYACGRAFVGYVKGGRSNCSGRRLW